MGNWYIFRVKTGSEEKTRIRFEEELQDGNSFMFVPMVEYKYKFSNEVKTNLKPMFLGYIFAETDNISFICRSISKRMLDCWILKDGDGKVTPMPQHEVDFLMQFVDEDYSVRASIGVKEYDRIIITKGPLVGKEGLIKKIDRHKRIAILEVGFMGEVRRVTLGLEVISALDAAI